MSGAPTPAPTCAWAATPRRGRRSRCRRTGNPVAGSTDLRSAGNGCLTRLAPVAVRHWQDRGTLRGVAARQSRTTHAAPEAVDGCVVHAELLADTIAGERRSVVMLAREDLLGPDGSNSPASASILVGPWRGKPRSVIHASGYVAHTLGTALWSMGAPEPFCKAVLKAANLGEDANVTAPVAGQLAGALHEASGIPEGWQARVT